MTSRWNNNLVVLPMFLFLLTAGGFTILLVLHAPEYNSSHEFPFNQRIRSLSIRSEFIHMQSAITNTSTQFRPYSPLPRPPPPPPSLSNDDYHTSLTPASQDSSVHTASSGPSVVRAPFRSPLQLPLLDASASHILQRPAEHQDMIFLVRSKVTDGQNSSSLKRSAIKDASSFLARMTDPPELHDIIVYLDAFIKRLHVKFLGLKHASKFDVFEAYRSAAERELLPFDKKWSNRTIYPVRKDGSIFISIASYRYHRLENTLKEAFGKARHPEKLFAGVVMQNCHENCKTGVLVVSPPGQRPPKTEVHDAPPDSDGVRSFCSSGLPWKTYCDRGNIRLLSIREEESLGPCIARYFASKLWGGEEYFMQIDSHIWFVKDWDEKLRNMMKNAPSSKPVISTYPPGNGGHWQGGHGPRICGASFSTSPVEANIIRIGASMTSKQPSGLLPNTPIAVKCRKQHHDVPTASLLIPFLIFKFSQQAPYVAAGFFVAPSSFLAEMPFDPFLPWVFMGEEIMLSTRFFTHGYDIFAPSENILAHE